MLWASFGFFNVPTIMLCLYLGRSFRLQVQPSFQFMSNASQGRQPKLLRVTSIITIVSDCRIGIRCSSLFLSIGWEVEVESRYATFAEAMGWRCVFIPPHSSCRSPFIPIAFVFRNFLLPVSNFPSFVIVHLWEFVTEMLLDGDEVLWGPYPFGPLRMYSAWLLPEP